LLCEGQLTAGHSLILKVPKTVVTRVHLAVGERHDVAVEHRDLVIVWLNRAIVALEASDDHHFVRDRKDNIGPSAAKPGRFCSALILPYQANWIIRRDKCRLIGSTFAHEPLAIMQVREEPIA
jgi:hypothetical protein